MKTHLTMNDRVENPRTMNLVLGLFIYLFLIFSYNFHSFPVATALALCPLSAQNLRQRMFYGVAALWKNVHITNRRWPTEEQVDEEREREETKKNGRKKNEDKN